MSLAKKCNRCGKYYDHYPTGNKITYNSLMRFQMNAKGDTVQFQDTIIDLCPECMDAFDKFMTSGGKFDDKT